MHFHSKNIESIINEFDIFYKDLSSPILIFDKLFNLIYTNDEFINVTNFKTNDMFSLQDFFKNENLKKQLNGCFIKDNFSYNFNSLKLFINNNLIFEIKGKFSNIYINNKVFLLCSFTISNKKFFISKSDEKIKGIIDFIPEAAIIHKDFKPLYFNEKLAELLDVQTKEFKKESFLNSIIPNQIEQVKESIKLITHKKNAVSVNEINLIDKNGNSKTIRLFQFAVNFQNQSCFFTILKDLSIHKIMENKLIENELMFKTIMNLTNFSMFIHQGTKFVLVNKAMVKLSGFSEKELMTMNYWDLVHPEQRKKVMNFAKDRLEGKNVPDRYEIKFVKKDKSYAWVDFNANPVIWHGKPAILGAAFDITDKKKSEKALKESEAKLRLILDLLPESVVIHNKSGILFYNKSSLKMFNIKEEDIKNVNLYDFIDKKFHELVDSRIYNILENKNTTPTQEVTLIKKTGESFDAEITGMPIEFSNQKAILTVINDISKHKKMEKLISEQKNLYQTLTELTISAIFIYQDNKFVFVNKATEEISGYSKKELLNMNFWDIVHPDNSNLIRKYGLARQKGDKIPNRYEFKIKNKRGEEIWVDFSAKRTTWQGKPAAIATVVDITDKKKYLQDLIETQARFKVLFEDHSIIQLILNPENLDIEDANHSACRFYGYNYKDIKKLNYREISLSNESTLQKNVEDIISKKRHYFIAKHKKVDGMVVDIEMYAGIVDIAGKKIIYAMIFDITNRIKMEEINRILSRSIEQNPASVIITDKFGFIVYVNPTFEEVTGYKKEEVLGKNPCVLKSGRHDNDFYKKLWDTIVAGEVWRGRIVNKNKFGNYFTEEAIISPVKDLNGEISHYVGIKIDVTKKLELEEKYEQARKMESIGHLAGGIAHNFNNLLTIILTNAEMSLMSLDKNSKPYEYVKEIQIASKKSSDLVSHLLAYAKKQQISQKIINLNELINKQYRILKKLVREEVELIWKPGKNLWNVKVDESHFEQIIINLCINASDAIKDKGKIEIKTENKTIEDNKILNQKEYVVLTISDDGIGMDEETKKRIFEPFFTTKNKEKGTGLGLATVLGIAKQNNLHIEVASEVNKGTTFSIFLPRAYENISEKQVSLPKKITKGNGETILITEDEQSILAITKEILIEHNYKVFTASSSKEALELVENSENNIDLLITDVIMPDMDGKQLSEKIKETYPKIKVLFMSGYSENIISDKGVLLNEINFIQKPFQIDNFLKTVRNILN